MQQQHDQQVPPNGESIEQQQRQRELLSLLTINDFTPIQMHIVISGIKGQSYSQIHWEGKSLYNRQISKCLKHSALGFTWQLNNESSKPPYLCRFDLDIHIEEAIEAFEHGISFDSYEIIGRAFEIRQDRITSGAKFLNKMGSEALAS